MFSATTNSNKFNVGNGLFKKLKSATLIQPNTTGNFSRKQCINMKAIQEGRINDIILENEYYGHSDYNKFNDSYTYHGRPVSRNNYWEAISRNCQAIKIALRNPDKINLKIMLNSNPNAYMFMLEYPQLFNSWAIYNYQYARTLFMMFPKKITWRAMDNVFGLQRYVCTDYSNVNWSTKPSHTQSKTLRFNWENLLAQIPK